MDQNQTRKFIRLAHESFYHDNFLAIWTSVNYIFETVDAKRDQAATKETTTYSKTTATQPRGRS